jgi:hypothetical protein
MCSDDHQPSAGVSYTNMSSINTNWTLNNPVVSFWRDKDELGTCFLFEQVE